MNHRIYLNKLINGQLSGAFSFALWVFFQVLDCRQTTHKPGSTCKEPSVWDRTQGLCPVLAGAYQVPTHWRMDNCIQLFDYFGHVNRTSYCANLGWQVPQNDLLWNISLSYKKKKRKKGGEINAGNPFNNLFEGKMGSAFMVMLLMGCQIYFPFPPEGH